MMLRFSLVFAGASGMLAVLTGAAASHWLVAAGYDAADIARVEKASAYQMYHSLALLGVGAMLRYAPSRSFALAAMLFATGIMCFSGSLYARVLLAMPQITAIAPLGGVALMLGWLAVAWGGVCCTAQKTAGQSQ